MKIIRERVFPGPNVYALYPVVRLTVDLGQLDERFSNELDGFKARLLEAVPQLYEHGCCFGVAGGFVRRLERGTLMGHTLEHVAIALQNLVFEGAEISFGKTRTTGRPRHYDVVYQAPDGEIGLEAGRTALKVLAGCLPSAVARRSGLSQEVPPGRAVGEFLSVARRRRLGPSASGLVKAAEKRKIPWRRLDDKSLIELGSGRYARRIRATITENTGSIAIELSCNKQLASRLLQEAGLPVPRSQLADDADAAVNIAATLGFPVVIKPLDGNHGRGVRVGLETEDDVREAFEVASREGRKILVQEHLIGRDHRLLVVGGNLVAAARRTPAHVIGNGVSSIDELVSEANADPRRGEGHSRSLSKLEIDEDARRTLLAQGLDLESVPAEGKRVWLQSIPNLSRGGVAEDVTDRVHPINRSMAERAARVLRLDVAGVDVIIPDISEPWRESGGGICEINAAPGFRMHLSPSRGKRRDVGAAVIDMLFPRSRRATAHTTAITGTNGKTTTARMLAHIQAVAGRCVGLATTDGVYADGELLAAGDLTGPMGSRMALTDPRVDSAVLEVARGGILRAGLGFDACEVGAVLNIGPDHLGFDGIDTVEEMAFVKRLVVEVALDVAVLNADDPLVAEMAPRCRRARRIIWTSRDRNSALIREHVEGGGTAVVLETEHGQSVIHIIEAGCSRPIVAASDIPATLGGAAGFNVANAMAATALAHAGGISDSCIRRGLASFRCSFETVPGRLNVYDGLPFRVILDYSHNRDAFRALGELVQSLEIPGRRILCFGLPGNRRDADLRATAVEVGKHFDEFIVHDDDDRRGRGPLEVPGIIERALVRSGVARDRIRVSDVDEHDAIRLALQLGEPGDLVVITAVDSSRAWETICQHGTGEVESERAGDSHPSGEGPSSSAGYASARPPS